MKTTLRTAALLLASACLLMPTIAQETAPPASPPTPTTVTGTVNINYNTRRPENIERVTDGKVMPKKGVMDEYTVDLNVGGRIGIQGKITRLPNLTSKWFGKETQAGQLYYNLNFKILKPTEISVGKWVGTVPMGSDGRYQLAGRPDAKHRIAIESIGAVTGFEDPFDGALIGKAGDKPGIKATFSRMIGGRQVTKTIDNADPMRFDGIVLAKGPVPNYPRTIVNGELNFDRETSNYFTKGITFDYQTNQKIVDTMTGSIRWIEDPNYTSNGQGAYEFNMRLNEAQAKPAQTEAAFSAPASDEDAFFAVVPGVSALTGKITFKGQMGQVGSARMPYTDSSTYNLQFTGFNPIQVINWQKLWLVAIGPTNDE